MRALESGWLWLDRRVSFEAGDGALGADRPAFGSCKADGVQVEVIGVLPVKAPIVADVGAMRPDRREIARGERCHR